MTDSSVIIDALARGPDLIVPLVREAHPDIVRRRPSPDRWSVHEHACHLAEVHPMIVGRLDLMLAVDDPQIVSYDPDREENPTALSEMDLDDALDRFRSDRAALVRRLRSLRPEHWARTARHDEYNTYSVYIMMRHLTLHDLFHAYRIEELVLRKGWPRAAQLAG